MTTHQELVSQICEAVEASNDTTLKALLTDPRIPVVFKSTNPKAKNNPLYLIQLAFETDDDSIAILDILFAAFSMEIAARDTTKLFRQFYFDSLTTAKKIKTQKRLHIIEKYMDNAKTFNNKSEPDSILAANILRFIINNRKIDLLQQCFKNKNLIAAVELLPNNKPFLANPALLGDAATGCYPAKTVCPFESTIKTLKGLEHNSAPTDSEHKPEFTSTKKETDSTDAAAKASLNHLRETIFDKDSLQANPALHCQQVKVAIDNLNCSKSKLACKTELVEMLGKLLFNVQAKTCDFTTPTSGTSCLDIKNFDDDVVFAIRFNSIGPSLTINDSNSATCSTQAMPAAECVDVEGHCQESMVKIAGDLVQYLQVVSNS